jgi:hypothetical protein
MDFIDYTWDQIEATFVKENILGSEFSFRQNRYDRFYWLYTEDTSSKNSNLC